MKRIRPLFLTFGAAIFITLGPDFLMCQYASTIRLNPEGQVSGIVKDNSGDGIGGVRVSVVGGTESTETTSNGTFILVVRGTKESALLRAFIKSYKSLDVWVAVPNNNCIITMEKEVSTRPTVTASAAIDDTAETDPNTPVVIRVLENDREVQRSVSSFKPAKNGAVEKAGNREVRYTPNQDFCGEDSFTYSIKTRRGNDATATVKVKVRPFKITAVDDGDTTMAETPVSINVLANDEAKGGELLDIIPPRNGIAVKSDSATIKYTPGQGFRGEEVFRYTIKDKCGSTATGTVTVTVKLPKVLAKEVARSIQAGRSVSVNLLENNEVLGGELIAVGLCRNGVIENIGNGIIKYTPAQKFVGDDSFSYEIKDRYCSTGSSWVRIKVEPPPIVAVNDAAETEAGKPVEVAVLVNDKAEEAKLTSFTHGDNGIVEKIEGDMLRYRPKQDFLGDDTFTYEIKDRFDGVASARVKVTVVRPAIAAVDDQRITKAGTELEIYVLDNDQAEGADILSVGKPEYGQVENIGKGKVRYNPGPSLLGRRDSFVYTIKDRYGSTSRAWVRVRIESPMTAAVNDEVLTQVGKPVDISLSANDQASVWSLKSLTPSANVSVQDLGNGKVRYFPKEGFHGEDIFSYEIKDKDGRVETARVKVMVELPAVKAVEDQALTDQGTAVDINVLANDQATEGEVTSVGPCANGRVENLGRGMVKYIPNEGYIGPDGFAYEIKDKFGGKSSSSVKVTVKAKEAR